MLRPEQITLIPLRPEQYNAASCLAKVVAIDFAGFISTLTLQIISSGETIEIKTISREDLHVGLTVGLDIMGQAHIFAE